MGFRTQLARRGRNRWRELDTAQQGALDVYAAAHGQKWKDDARKLWDASNPQTPVERIVYGLRSTHGLVWLNRCKVKASEALKRVGTAEHAELTDKQVVLAARKAVEGPPELAAELRTLWEETRDELEMQMLKLNPWTDKLAMDRVKEKARGQFLRSFLKNGASPALKSVIGAVLLHEAMGRRQ
jgi:hypothetical protein